MKLENFELTPLKLSLNNSFATTCNGKLLFIASNTKEGRDFLYFLVEHINSNWNKPFLYKKKVTFCQEKFYVDGIEMVKMSTFFKLFKDSSTSLEDMIALEINFIKKIKNTIEIGGVIEEINFPPNGHWSAD